MTAAPQTATLPALGQLRQIQRELLERDLVRRSDALDEVQAAVERLGEIGSSAAILERAAAELGSRSRFSRVLISQVDGRRLVPHSLWQRDRDGGEASSALGEAELTLDYPLVEAEVAARGGEAMLVAAAGPRSPEPLRRLFGWSSYVVVALRLRGATIGLLHAEPEPGDELGTELGREVAEIYAQGLTAAFERAVLREALARHREELRAAIDWMREHLDRELAEAGEGRSGEVRSGGGRQAGDEQLTPRELEVMELLGRGLTNAAIAASLLISESTVKFHVKNILLKLGATSRADAVARYIRGG